MKILSPDGQEHPSSRWLKVGNDYTALSLSVDSAGKVSVRIVADQGPGPSVFPLQQFEIVDSKLPSNWTISTSSKGGFNLAPAAWSGAGFWERYFDGDQGAAAVFEAERRKILSID